MIWSYVLWLLVVASLGIAIAALVRAESQQGSSRRVFMGDRERSGDRLTVPSSQSIEVDVSTENEDIDQLIFVQGRVNCDAVQEQPKGLLFLHIHVGNIQATHIIDPMVPASAEFYVCIPVAKNDRKVTFSFDGEFDLPDLTIDFLKTALVTLKPSLSQ